MRLLRMKPRFIEPIKNPRADGYKTKTTRMTERPEAEYELIVSLGSPIR